MNLQFLIHLRKRQLSLKNYDKLVETKIHIFRTNVLFSKIFVSL